MSARFGSSEISGTYLIMTVTNGRIPGRRLFSDRRRSRRSGGVKTVKYHIDCCCFHILTFKQTHVTDPVHLGVKIIDVILLVVLNDKLNPVTGVSWPCAIGKPRNIQVTAGDVMGLFQS